MSLRELAAADFRAFAEDATLGFGWPITVTGPEGASATLTGFSNDIHQVVDPSTGQMVAGRSASITLPIAALDAAGICEPKGIADTGVRPWVIRFSDSRGIEHVFKVSEAMPDRAIGAIVCTLETYIP